MTIRNIHVAWAWVVIIGNGMAGLWALAALKIATMRTKALWWFTLFVELAIFVQVGLGVYMVSSQKRHVKPFHMFYGFLAIIAIGLLYSYAKQMRQRLYKLYGFGGLFIMGLGIRALLVGRG